MQFECSSDVNSYTCIVVYKYLESAKVIFTLFGTIKYVCFLQVRQKVITVEIILLLSLVLCFHIVAALAYIDEKSRGISPSRGIYIVKYYKP